MVNGNCKWQPFLANIACDYVFFPQTDPAECMGQIQRSIQFFLVQMQNLRVSAVVHGFLEEREVILGSGISFKTQRIWIQLVNLFLLAVIGQGQFTAYGEGLVLLIKLNTLWIFFILSLAARMKSKIQSLGSGAPPSCFGKATPNVYVLLGSCLALDCWKW